ncbi:MAG: hypothetical protein KDK65_01740 [Chlamydiia bacterium]|nr:hypothetical protein [Chlamydiia bacterium]
MVALRVVDDWEHKPVNNTGFYLKTAAVTVVTTTGLLLMGTAEAVAQWAVANLSQIVTTISRTVGVCRWGYDMHHFAHQKWRKDRSYTATIGSVVLHLSNASTLLSVLHAFKVIDLEAIAKTLSLPNLPYFRLITGVALIGYTLILADAVQRAFDPNLTKLQKRQALTDIANYTAQLALSSFIALGGVQLTLFLPLALAAGLAGSCAITHRLYVAPKQTGYLLNT